MRLGINTRVVTCWIWLEVELTPPHYALKLSRLSNEDVVYLFYINEQLFQLFFLCFVGLLSKNFLRRPEKTFLDVLVFNQLYHISQVLRCFFGLFLGNASSCMSRSPGNIFKSKNSRFLRVTPALHVP